MACKESLDHQLYLFLTQLRWHELPADVRQQVVELLARPCVDIVVQRFPSFKEQSDEPTET